MRLFLLLLIFLSSIIQQCKTHRKVDSTSDLDDSTTFSLDKYAHIEPIRNAPNEALPGWENYFFSKSDCRCIFNGEYAVSVRNKYPGSRNLMITLQGGGASWPGLEECKEALHEDDIYATEFATELADRLEDEWNGVMIPYCDGSVYMGDNSADYDEDGVVDHWHWGFRASSAGVSFIVKTFPELDKIFITGCSAGGYGSFVVTRLIRHHYPGARIYVINESGPGLFNPDDRQTWNSIKSAWSLDQLIPENCEPCDGQIIYMYDGLMENDRNLKIGLYSSYEDEVLWNEYLGMEPEEFKSLLMTSSGYLHEKYPTQFNRFFIKGYSHCVGDRDYKIDGISYWEWILQFMNDSDQWNDILE